MQQVYIKNFASWREAARQLLATEASPDKVIWHDSGNLQNSLFNETLAKLVVEAKYKVPKEFMALAEKISCHSDFKKWNILYTALWRITHGEKFLLNISADPLIRKLEVMNKQISFEAHKTKAFVRFRKCEDGEGEHYIAWHNPPHQVLRLVAPFFSRRFADMRWTIFTSYESASWDGENLSYGEGIPSTEAPEPDKLEDMWRTYYRATFNPARVKIKAMKKEMPVRHWPTLPETEIIQELLGEAPKRVEKMIEDAARNLG